MPGSSSRKGVFQWKATHLDRTQRPGLPRVNKPKPLNLAAVPEPRAGQKASRMLLRHHSHKPCRLFKPLIHVSSDRCLVLVIGFNIHISDSGAGSLFATSSLIYLLGRRSVGLSIYRVSRMFMHVARHHISSINSSSRSKGGKSPTWTLSGFTKTPDLGGQEK